MSGLTDYSKSPGNNAFLAPENWLGAAVNDAMRQLMADLKNYAEQSNWVSVLKDAGTYGDKTVTKTTNGFTVTADVAAYFKAGQAVRFVDSGGVELGRNMVASDAVFASGMTTVVLKTPPPAGTIGANGVEIFSQRANLAPPFYFAGTGNTTARDASIYGTSPLSFALWLNIDDVFQPMVQVGFLGTWRNLCPLEAFPNKGLLSLKESSGAATVTLESQVTTFIITAFSKALEIRDDGALYFDGKKLSSPAQSAQLTIAPNSTQIFAHGLAAIPTETWFQLECISTDHGYGVGDVLPVVPITGQNATGTTGFCAVVDAINVTINFANVGGTNPVFKGSLPKTAPFNLVDLDNSKWKFRAFARL